MTGLVGYFRDRWELWQFFLLLISMCMLSAIFIFSVTGKLEKASES